MQARLARYAHISPSEFARLTPTRTRQLNTDVSALVDDEWGGFIELAKMIARSGARF